jgi:pyruvate dehydrogenase E1 component alpha subunit
MQINKEKMLEMYKTMLTIRRFEEKVIKLYAKGAITGAAHLYIGEEAIAAGVCANLKSDDYITSTHRGHGHLIAKGGKLNLMMAELFQKKTGYCKGKGGSMHICDMSLGIIGSNGIVGAGLVIANGAGQTCKVNNRGQVCVCFFGDGAANRGTFHEGINMASIWKLPVIFVCENNYYGISGCQRDMMNICDISDRAKSYGIPGITADGNNVLAVYNSAAEAIERARNGGGPSLLEFTTWRHRGHWEGDPDEWREKEEHEMWLKREPVAAFSNYLIENNKASKEEIAGIEEEVATELADAINFAKESPDVTLDQLYEDVYFKGQA